MKTILPLMLVAVFGAGALAQEAPGAPLGTPSDTPTTVPLDEFFTSNPPVPPLELPESKTPTTLDPYFEPVNIDLKFVDPSTPCDQYPFKITIDGAVVGGGNLEVAGTTSTLSSGACVQTPDYTIRASALTYDATSKMIKGENIAIETRGTKLKAARMEIIKGVLHAYDATATPCKCGEDLKFSSKDILIDTKTGKLTTVNAKVELYGAELATIPSYTLDTKAIPTGTNPALIGLATLGSSLPTIVAGGGDTGAEFGVKNWQVYKQGTESVTVSSVLLGLGLDKTQWENKANYTQGTTKVDAWGQLTRDGLGYDLTAVYLPFKVRLRDWYTVGVWANDTREAFPTQTHFVQQQVGLTETFKFGKTTTTGELALTPMMFWANENNYASVLSEPKPSTSTSYTFSAMSSVRTMVYGGLGLGYNYDFKYGGWQIKWTPTAKVLYQHTLKDPSTTSAAEKQATTVSPLYATYSTTTDVSYTEPGIKVRLNHYFSQQSTDDVIRLERMGNSNRGFIEANLGAFSSKQSYDITNDKFVSQNAINSNETWGKVDLSYTFVVKKPLTGQDVTDTTKRTIITQNELIAQYTPPAPECNQFNVAPFMAYDFLRSDISRYGADVYYSDCCFTWKLGFQQHLIKQTEFNKQSGFELRFGVALR